MDLMGGTSGPSGSPANVPCSIMRLMGDGKVGIGTTSPIHFYMFVVRVSLKVTMIPI